MLPLQYQLYCILYNKYGSTLKPFETTVPSEIADVEYALFLILAAAFGAIQYTMHT